MQFTSGQTQESDAVPLARIILDTRRYKRISGFMAVTLCLSTLALYPTLIHPTFLPADYTNPAVLKFLTSDSHKAQASEIFRALDAYNDRQDITARRPPDNFATDFSQFGLVVTLSQQLTPLKPEFGQAAGTKKAQQYRYENTLAVRPDLSVLIAFCILETFLIAVTVYILTQKRPNAELVWEEHVLQQYFSPGEHGHPANEWPGHTAALRSMLQNFHACCLQLNRRRGGRPGLPIKDEHDVQDVLHALLKLHFGDIRPEEPTPSLAGSWTRMDFLLPDTGIVIEVKMARSGRADRQIGEELLLDVAHYAAHSECKHLVCFIYDPDHNIVNAATLRKGLAQFAASLRVEVIVSPQP